MNPLEYLLSFGFDGVQAVRETGRVAKGFQGINTAAAGAERGGASAASAIAGMGRSLMGLLGVSLTLEGAKSLGQHAIANATEMIEFSERISASRSKVQDYTIAFGRMGATVGQVELAFRAMATHADAAMSHPNDEAMARFARYGITLAEIKNLRPDQLFDKLGTALGQSANRQQALADATALFGRGAQALLPTLRDFQNLMEWASKSSSKVSDDTLSANRYLGRQGGQAGRYVTAQGEKYLASTVVPSIAVMKGWGAAIGTMFDKKTGSSATAPFDAMKQTYEREMRMALDIPEVTPPLRRSGEGQQYPRLEGINTGGVEELGRKLDALHALLSMRL